MLISPTLSLFFLGHSNAPVLIFHSILIKYLPCAGHYSEHSESTEEKNTGEDAYPSGVYVLVGKTGQKKKRKKENPLVNYMIVSNKCHIGQQSPAFGTRNWCPYEKLMPDGLWWS